METGCRGKRPSDIAACHFARDLKLYSKVEYSERGGKCGQTDSIGSEGDGSPWKESIRLAACQFTRDLESIQQRRVYW